MTFRFCSAAALSAATMVALSGSAPHAQQAATRKDPAAAMQSIQGFNIVLLVGESVSSGSPVEEVPVAARKALADMRDFLPFKHYRVLDSHWTSCCVMPMAAPLSGRLQGVIGSGGESTGTVRLLPRTFGYTLHVTPDGGRLGIRFAMRQDEGAGGRSGASRVGADTANETQLRQELLNLERQLESARQRAATANGRSSASRAQADESVNSLMTKYNALRNEYQGAVAGERSSARAIIDSSFMMDVGETVVVGTSRLGGDKALIALVTAARRTSAR
ncbi:hypothetical protein BH18ACI5_BH18ACI5_28100 [soil metagenome]